MVRGERCSRDGVLLYGVRVGVGGIGVGLIDRLQARLPAMSLDGNSCLILLEIAILYTTNGERFRSLRFPIYCAPFDPRFR